MESDRRLSEKHGKFWMLSAKNTDMNLTYTDLLLGGASIDVHGVPLTDETIEEAKEVRCSADGFHWRRCKNFPMV